jgi:hypothetical protein
MRSESDGLSGGKVGREGTLGGKMTPPFLYRFGFFSSNAPSVSNSHVILMSFMSKAVRVISLSSSRREGGDLGMEIFDASRVLWSPQGIL